LGITAQVELQLDRLRFPPLGVPSSPPSGLRPSPSGRLRPGPSFVAPLSPLRAALLKRSEQIASMFVAEQRVSTAPSALNVHPTMFDLRLQDLAHLKTDSALVSWVLRPILRHVRERFSELSGSEVENLIMVLNDLKIAFAADPNEALASGFLEDLLGLVNHPLLKKTSFLDGGIYTRLSKTVHEVITTLTSGKVRVTPDAPNSIWHSNEGTWRSATAQGPSAQPLNPPSQQPGRVTSGTRSWTWGGSTSLSPFLSDPSFASIYLSPLDATNSFSAPSTPSKASTSMPLPSIHEQQQQSLGPSSLSRTQTPMTDHFPYDEMFGLSLDIEKLLDTTPEHKQSRLVTHHSTALNLQAAQVHQRVLPPQAVIGSSRRGSGSDVSSVAESSFASLTSASSMSSDTLSPHSSSPHGQYGPYEVLIRILEENRAKHGSMELEMAPLGMRMGTLVPDWRERFKVRHLKEFVLRAYEAGIISMRHVGTQQTFIAPKAWMQQQLLGTVNPDDLSMLNDPERNTPSPPTTALFGDKRVVGSVVHVREHFGFIRCKCMEADVFFHRRDLADPLQGMPSVGDLLEFSLVKNKRTKQVSAVRVAKLETDEVPVSPSGSSEEIAATNFSFEPLSPTVSSTLSEDAMIGFSRTSSSSIAN